MNSEFDITAIDRLLKRLSFVALICLFIWIAAVAIDKAVHAGELILSVGIGAISDNDLYDNDGESVDDDPIARGSIAYAEWFNKHIGLSASVQHYSSAPADDQGLNWGGVDILIRF